MSAALPPEDAESNYRMTREALLSKVPLPAEQIHRMEGELEPEEACGAVRGGDPQWLSAGRGGDADLRSRAAGHGR